MISLEGLGEDFRLKVDDVLDACRRDGVEMRPYFGLRDVETQAKLWRQSRSTEEIESAIRRLKASDAPFLADVLERVGPQNGEHVTNALPGMSWHQWGEAVDCFWAVNGRAEWSTTVLIDGINGYRIYAEKARAIGLDAGLFWKSFKDSTHLQLRSDGSPVEAGYNLAAIDDAMKLKFG